MNTFVLRDRVLRLSFSLAVMRQSGTIELQSHYCYIVGYDLLDLLPDYGSIG